MTSRFGRFLSVLMVKLVQRAHGAPELLEPARQVLRVRHPQARLARLGYWVTNERMRFPATVGIVITP